MHCAIRHSYELRYLSLSVYNFELGTSIYYYFLRGSGLKHFLIFLDWNEIEQSVTVINIILQQFQL